MRLTDYSKANIDLETGETFAGIAYFPDVKTIIGDSIVNTTTVENGEHYRPDKIADRLWGIPDLNWVLDILNDFTIGIPEYVRNTKIKYVTLEQLKKVGIV